MTTEEKAKSYDEALERAREFQKSKDGLCVLTAESIFPELRESEDELTWLTKFIEEEAYSLSMDIWDNEDRIKLKNLQRSLAWLEKQGEQKNKINSCKITFEDILALECAIKTIKIIEGSDELYKILVHLYNKIHNAYLVEKQCKEEEPQVYETENGEIITYSETDGYKVIGSKFKVGDWIACEELNSVRIVAVDIDKYEVEFTDGAKAFPHIEYIDRNFHLWTIEDANDGDVLACGDKVTDCPFIFHDLNEELNPRSYCGVNMLQHFQDNDENGGSWCSSTVVRPATKEQSDFLFSKMKEEGYRWDDNKKELKNIEQKPTYNIGLKFKVGDWIITKDKNVHKDYSVCKIVEIENNRYHLENGDYLDRDTLEQYDYHLWTIEDAKDGDILTNGEIILIFKQFEEPAYKQHIIAYIGLDISRNIQVTNDYWQLGVKASPATKEQRDLLFSKMKDVGYRWDDEKKELKKINSYCQENCKGYQETGKCFADGGCDAKRKAEQKSTAWSEKDDKAIESLLHTLDSIEDEWFHDMTEEKYWLKSIKNRLTTK